MPGVIRYRVLSDRKLWNCYLSTLGHVHWNFAKVELRRSGRYFNSHSWLCNERAHIGNGRRTTAYILLDNEINRLVAEAQLYVFYLLWLLRSERDDTEFVCENAKLFCLIQLRSQLRIDLDVTQMLDLRKQVADNAVFKYVCNCIHNLWLFELNFFHLVFQLLVSSLNADF